MFSHAVRARSLKVALGFAITGISLIGTTASQAAGQPNSSRFLFSALINATNSRSAHETSSEVVGSKRASFSDDVANSSGRQDIITPDGSQAHVLVVGKFAYISGNQDVFMSYFGFPRAVARVVGGRWVSIPSATGEYATVANNATLPSALADITPSGRLTELAATKIHGESVIGIRGRLPSALKQSGTEVLYVTRSNHPLPVSATLTGRGIGTLTTSLSDWGEHVAITPPPSSIPLRQL